MISARWRADRLAMIATSLIDMEAETQQSQTRQSADPARPVSLGFKSLADNSRAISLAMRYESRLSRMHQRAQATLLHMQEKRMQSAKPEPASSRPAVAGDGAGAGVSPGSNASNTQPSAHAPQPKPLISNPSCARRAENKTTPNEPAGRYLLAIYTRRLREKIARRAHRQPTW
jgi:hypothetical protein